MLGVALQLLRVDDGHVEARLDAVIEEHRVQRLPPRRGKPERDVGDAERRLAPGQGFLDQPDAFDRLDARADVVLIARPDRKDQRVEDDVFGRDAVLLRQDVVGALGDGELPLAGDRLGLLLVLVDAADNEGRPVPLRQRHDDLKAFLAVLQVHAVDQRLARRQLERLLDHRGVGGVDDDGRLDLLGQRGEEGGHVLGLVAVGVLQADVEQMRAAADLTAPDLRRLFDSPFVDQAAELAAAEYVGALANQDGARVLVHDEGVQAREPRAGRRAEGARGLRLGGAANALDMAGHGTAAPAEDVDPAVDGEPFENGGDHLRRLVVVAVLVGQARVGETGDGEAGDRGQRTHVIGHELGASGAVQPDPEEVAVGEGGVEGLHVLTAEDRPHRLNGGLDGDGEIDAGCLRRAVDPFEGRLHVQRVLRRLDEKEVGAALGERGGQRPVGIDKLVPRRSAGDGEAFRRRPHRAGDPTRPFLGGEVAGGPPRDLSRGPPNLLRLRHEVVLGEHHRHGAERVRLDDVSPGLEESAVDALDGVGPGEVQALVTAVVLLAAEVVGSEVQRLDARAHGAVDDQNPLRQGAAKTFDALWRRGWHGVPHTEKRLVSLYEPSLWAVCRAG